MKIFGKLKKDKEKEQDSSPVCNYEGLCATAVEYAKSFDKVLDYSERSIDDLEDILQYYHEDCLKNDPTDHQIMSMALIFGVYLGQTLLNNGLLDKNYSWIVTEDHTPILRRDNKNEISPVTKVYKRLKNGPEDHVKSFYDVAFIMVEEGQL